jgi:hypothetical protein
MSEELNWKEEGDNSVKYEVQEEREARYRKISEETAKALVEDLKETFSNVYVTYDILYTLDIDVVLGDVRQVGLSVVVLQYTIDFLEAHNYHAFWVRPHGRKRVQIMSSLKGDKLKELS